MMSAAEAVSDIPSGASLAVGGFGVCLVPDILIEALLAANRGDLFIYSNNCGIDDYGLGRLLAAGRIRSDYLPGRGITRMGLRSPTEKLASPSESPVARRSVTEDLER